MKIDFTKALLTIKGAPIKSSSEPDAPDLTLQDAAVNALLMPAEKGATFDQSANAFKLALRISNSPADCDVKSEEISQIKQAIGRIYGPIVCGPAEVLLEGN